MRNLIAGKIAVQRANLHSKIATVVAVAFLSGCYPAFLTSRPKARIIVTNESGAPLEGATVTLATMERRGVVGQNTFEKFSTDRNGMVKFGRQHDWVMQVLLPDGDTGYSWTLCVSKPGFEAIPLTSMKFDEPIKFAMYPGAMGSECEWHRHEYMPRVKEREARWIEVGGGEPQTHRTSPMFTDGSFHSAMEASARQQGIKLRSWSEYRFQYQARSTGIRDFRLFIHAICRAPVDFDLSNSFYSEPDDRACYFDTTYTGQSYTDQPKPAFSPLQLPTVAKAE